MYKCTLQYTTHKEMHRMRAIRVNKTTGFRPDVLTEIVARCESENKEWNDVIDELLRIGLGMERV